MFSERGKMNIQKFFFVVLLAISFSCSQAKLAEISSDHQSLQVTTLYGNISVQEPILISLINHSAFQRLKYINQYGLVHYAQGEPHYTRYEHSLGVYFLTQKYGAPLKEQIAALLHDVSHTVFSHVGDAYFKSNYQTGKEAYQDTIHEWYLGKVGISTILVTYGHGDACSSEQKGQQRCYDQSLPDLCADRIEYNLAGGFIDGLLTKGDITWILSELKFKDGQWFFTDLNAAQKFGHVSIQLSENRWGGARCAFLDRCGALVLKRACTLGIITEDDIHFSQDDIVWKKLCNCNDADIAQIIRVVQENKNAFSVSLENKGDLRVTGKFSGTDPFVATQNGLQRLTVLDDGYKAEFNRVRALVRKGYTLNLEEGLKRQFTSAAQ